MRKRAALIGLMAAPAAILIAALIHGCSNEGLNSTPQQTQQPGTVPPEGFSGRFEGTESGTQDGAPFQGPLSMAFMQNGGQVNGNWAAPRGGVGAGTLIGTATGNHLSFTATENATGCTSSGTATIGGDEITGTWATQPGSGCHAGELAFDVFRQGPRPSPSPGPGSPVNEG